MEKNPVLDALLGVAVGDALGVPFEFRTRVEMEMHPAMDMVGFGTHGQPKGTWSDDSSLAFCLAESLLGGYDVRDISVRFIKWMSQGYWSARGQVFDIGMTTSEAIHRLSRLVEKKDFDGLREQRYLGDVYENGNGSLMRILPLLFYVRGKEARSKFQIIWEVSALTHRHIRAAMSCMVYLSLAEHLLGCDDKNLAYSRMREEIQQFWEEMEFAKDERQHFDRVITNDVCELSVAELTTGGYVIDSLESAIWFFMNSHSYKETVLGIINLGEDTDTSAAIAGGLAGLYYGAKGIPQDWVNSLARIDDIRSLAEKLNQVY